MYLAPSMRITYVTHTRFPTEKAHGVQVAHVCAALAELKHQVTLIAPTIGNAITLPAHAYYGVPADFEVRHLRQFDALSSPFVPGKLAMIFSMVSYRKKLTQFLALHHTDLLYTRTPILASALLASGLPVVLELHTLPRRFHKRFVTQCNRCALVVCLTTPMRDELVSWGLDAKHVIVEADAVDLERFSNTPTLAKAKHQWDLPEKSFVVGYVGSLVTYDSLRKGIDVLIEAIVDLRKRRVPVFGWIVGGPKSWQDRYGRLASVRGLTTDDIEFHDAIPSRLVPEALAACDVLVYPAPASRHPYFQRDTSPLKLFEYLASGRPVVCADIPPVRDIVDSDAVRLVHPGSARSLAGGILDVMEHPSPARKRAIAGKQIVQDHTWEKRMRRILAKVQKSMRE